MSKVSLSAFRGNPNDKNWPWEGPESLQFRGMRSNADKQAAAYQNWADMLVTICIEAMIPVMAIRNIRVICDMMQFSREDCRDWLTLKMREYAIHQSEQLQSAFRNVIQWQDSLMASSLWSRSFENFSDITVTDEPLIKKAKIEELINTRVDERVGLKVQELEVTIEALKVQLLDITNRGLAAEQPARAFTALTVNQDMRPR